MLPKTFHERLAEQSTPPECTELPPEYYFADELDEDEPYGRSERAIAVTACRRCPIRRECAEYAITTNQRFGVWGGLVPAQLVAARLRRELDAEQSRN